ncbi:hypothetical protein Pmani_034193 [Petrolisthes manimaculis]|uniref:Uncharacterized protein n=1 Tax=Petrolisthes manimaculis TaxID=1843537 RepID=A0AAE1NN19_9EUCA|nr:hypothetical protein Pmani_034193 [Petrolisthes manimaculis]
MARSYRSSSSSSTTPTSSTSQATSSQAGSLSSWRRTRRFLGDNGRNPYMERETQASRNRLRGSSHGVGCSGSSWLESNVAFLTM